MTAILLKDQMVLLVSGDLISLIKTYQNSFLVDSVIFLRHQTLLKFLKKNTLNQNTINALTKMNLSAMVLASGLTVLISSVTLTSAP